jgi:uncharacterized protein (DUF58 family)
VTVATKDLLKQLRRIEITTRRLANDQLTGNYASVVKGQGLAFREVRPYQPGDDVRAIDWNVSARAGEAFIKVFVEEREMTVMLVVDLSASQRFGTQRSAESGLAASKAQVAAMVAGACAFSAIHNNDRVGLIVATDRIEKIVPPKRGDKHAMRVIREILEFRPQHTGTDLRIALQTLVQVAKRRAVCFVLSDFIAGGFDRTLALASARHDIIPVMLTDRRDDELPDVGLAMFEDLETGEEAVVDTSDPAVRAWYAHQVRTRRAASEQLFRKLGLDLVKVDTGKSFIGPLRDLFARRARRARS